MSWWISLGIGIAVEIAGLAIAGSCGKESLGLRRVIVWCALAISVVFFQMTFMEWAQNGSPITIRW